MKILVTGGAGYIGSHTVMELLDNGYDVVVIDSLINSSRKAIERIESITGKNVKLYTNDLCERDVLEGIFAENAFDCVIHFAGLKAVGESVKQPLKYYRNNIDSTISLLEVMEKCNVKKLIFSSSATVYGASESFPVKETFPLSATSPYGRTKLMIEEILNDVYAADNSWNIIILRYFNPVGAHESGMIGEDPVGIPNNLTPYIAKVATGQLPQIGIFGSDYETIDGTGVRDYVHVVDLARGHVKAIEKQNQNGVHIYNLGTGKGHSVLEVISAFEKACGKTLKKSFMPRRDGDIAISYASVNKAKEELNWKAELSLDDMCTSLWNWQCKNPNGYN